MCLGPPSLGLGGVTGGKHTAAFQLSVWTRPFPGTALFQYICCFDPLPGPGYVQVCSGPLAHRCGWCIRACWHPIGQAPSLWSTGRLVKPILGGATVSSRHFLTLSNQKDHFFFFFNREAPFFHHCCITLYLTTLAAQENAVEFWNIPRPGFLSGDIVVRSLCFSWSSQTWVETYFKVLKELSQWVGGLFWVCFTLTGVKTWDTAQLWWIETLILQGRRLWRWGLSRQIYLSFFFFFF